MNENENFQYEMVESVALRRFSYKSFFLFMSSFFCLFKFHSHFDD